MSLIRRMVWSAALVLVGCGDSGGSTVSMSNSDSQSGTDATDATDGTGATEPTGGSDSMTEATGGGVSESQSGTTGDEGGVSDSLSGTVSSEAMSDSNSGGTTTDTTGMISGGGETTGTESSTGEPIDCATLDSEAECVAADCLPVLGQKFVTDDADWCIDPPSFLACLDPQNCDSVVTVACKGAVKYQLANGCVPGGFQACMGPADQGMDGFKDCL